MRDRLVSHDLTVGQLVLLTEAIEQVADGRPSTELSVREVAEALRESKLSHVAVDLVADLADVLAPLAGNGDVLDQVTLGTLQRVIGDGRRRRP